LCISGWIDSKHCGDLRILPVLADQLLADHPYLSLKIMQAVGFTIYCYRWSPVEKKRIVQEPKYMPESLLQ